MRTLSSSGFRASATFYLHQFARDNGGYLAVQIISTGLCTPTKEETECSVSLNFRGSSIFWYSTRFRGGGTAKVSVDSATPVLVSTDDPQGTGQKARVPILEWTNLDPDSEHVFTLSYVSGSFLDVDFFSILGDDSKLVGPVAGIASTPTSSPVTPRSSSAASPTGSKVLTNLTGGTATSAPTIQVPEAYAPAPASDLDDETQSLDPGIIAGIVTGTVAAVSFMIIGAYIWYRRRNRGRPRPRGFVIDKPISPVFPIHRSILLLDNSGYQWLFPHAPVSTLSTGTQIYEPQMSYTSIPSQHSFGRPTTGSDFPGNPKPPALLVYPMRGGRVTDSTYYQLRP